MIPAVTELAPTLEVACRRRPGEPAITYADTTISYGRFWEQALALAGAYLHLGIRPGDRVVCALRCCPEHLVAVAAAWACGAVHVGAHHDLTGSELASLVQRTDATAVVIQGRIDAADTRALVDAVGAAAPAATAIVHGTADGTALELAGLLGTAEPVEPTSGDVERTATLFLTSGTTGQPKAVVESLSALVAKVRFFADAVAPGVDDVHLMYLPLCHAFGLKLALMALLSGGRLVMLNRFTPSEALRLVTSEQVTVLPATPTHLTLLLTALDPTCHRVESLRWVVSAAASLPRPLAQQVYDRLGAEIFYVYGCSEGFLTATTDRREILTGSVGHRVFRGPSGTPAAGSVRVVGQDPRRPLPPGEMGEIAFSAATPVRYWNQPDAATDGWYRTGDLGRLDPDGSLYVLGRRKELVNRGGQKIAPVEVEAALADHPGVADAAVVGTPDPVLGDAICACVTPAGASPPTLDELRRFLATRLARHKLPDELCVVDRLPRSRTGKLDRPALLELVSRPDRHRERLRPR
ncbi:MAG: fatty acid--CoA ligase family protein [Actinomycetota bacterium]|nr:fatty acid--CoA ligase family protein [Actinomycetota bacterium]